MTWNYEESRERITKHLAELDDIEVEKLVREMDLENLTEKTCRQIYGAHVYAELGNLSALVESMNSTGDRKLIVQATHLYQRELARIGEAVDVARIQFQGSRAHFLAYRPIRDARAIATKAVLLQLIIDRFGVVFSDEFTELPDLRVRSGSDIGEAIGTRNGPHGDRELLFLGAPANHAAKLIGAGSERRMTEAVKVALPAALTDLVEEDGAGVYKLTRPSVEALAEMLKTFGIKWSAAECAQRLTSERVTFPVKDVGLSGATDRIDFDELSFYDTKVVAAASVYGDVSGFTAYIDGAVSMADKKAALRAFHAVRREMARVVKSDFNGVRVQFQGDRVQALFHLPADDVEGFSDEAVSAGVGLQSSFELVLKNVVAGIGELGIAVGISQGTTIATKLGERGHRDRICLGAEVLRAERNEENVDQRQIGISANVRENLPDHLAKHFVWNAGANCYVATGLDQNKLDLDEAARDLNKAKPVYIAASAGGAQITTRPGAGIERQPSRSYSE